MSDTFICNFCKKETEGEEKLLYEDWGTYAVCNPCYEKHLKAMTDDAWYYASHLIKLEEIHCIKCANVLGKDDMRNSDESRVEFECPHCEFSFWIWHGEYDDYDYYDYMEEKEGKDYAESMKHWRENGEKGPRPRTPEERRIDEANITKYGEC